MILDLLIKWYNCLHMSLNWDVFEKISPGICMQDVAKRKKIVDGQTGEKYEVKEGPNYF